MEQYIKINKDNWEIAVRDIKLVASFLEGMSIGKEERDLFRLDQNTYKLTNAVQWLNNFGDEKAQEKNIKILKESAEIGTREKKNNGF